MNRRSTIRSRIRATLAPRPTAADTALRSEVGVIADRMLPTMLLGMALVLCLLTPLSLVVWHISLDGALFVLRVITAVCFAGAAVALRRSAQAARWTEAIAALTGLLLLINGFTTLASAADGRFWYELALIIVILGLLPLPLLTLSALLVIALVGGSLILFPVAGPQERLLALYQITEAIAAALVFAIARIHMLHEFARIKRDDRERELRLTEALAVAEQQRDQTRQRDTILDAVSFTASQLLQTAHFDDAVSHSFGHLGVALAASHLVLLQNTVAADGALSSVPLMEWSQDGTRIIPPNSYPIRSYQARGLERWVTELRSGALISGLRSEFPPAEAAYLERSKLRSILVAPISVEQQWWGCLGIDQRDHDRVWSRADQEALRAVAGIIGAALQRSQADAARARAEQETRFLADASAALVSSLQIDTVLQTLTTLCVPQIAEFCSIHILDNASGNLREVAYTAATPELQLVVEQIVTHYPITPSDTVGFVKVFHSGVSEFIPEITPAWLAAIAQDAEHLALLQQADLRSALTVALRSTSRIYGTIALRRSGPAAQHFDQQSLRFIEELARRAAVAIENTQLYAQAQRRLAEVSTVQQLARMINSRLDLAAILETTVIQISSTFGYKMVSIYLLEHQELVLQHYVGYDQVYRTIAIGTGVAGRSVRTRRAAFVRDASQEPDFIYARGDVTQGIFVPLMDGAQQVLGLLSVESRGSPVLTEDDFALLLLVADQVSLAVVNARLLADARHELVERQRAEQARLQLERKMLDAQKLESLGVLVGGIAHDFNNLLTVVQGNTHLAKSDVPPDSFAAESLTQIELATRHASELVKQMLLYAGKGRFVKELLNLNTLIGQIASLLHVTIPRTIRLVYDLAETPPQIEADPSQIRQVVMNLVLNAAEAHADGEGLIRLSTEVCWLDQLDLADSIVSEPLLPGHYVRLRISDTGVGMDAQTLSRIFDPFFTTKFAGRGLGLAAVLGIIRSHGGGLQVQSAPGRGTTFSVLVPSANPVEQLTLPDSAALVWRGAGLALVVDDEPSVRLFAARALQRLGFETVTAADGVAAVAIVGQRAQELRCVLLDLTMPRMSGAEAFETIRALAPDLPVLLMSGYDTEDALQRFVQPPAFLPKPFTVTALSELLQDVLRADA